MTEQELREENDVLKTVLRNFLQAQGHTEGHWQIMRVPRLVWMHANETEATIARRESARGEQT